MGPRDKRDDDIQFGFGGGVSIRWRARPVILKRIRGFAQRSGGSSGPAAAGKQMSAVEVTKC